MPGKAGRSGKLHNLRVKTKCEIFKDTVIGKGIEILPESKLPLKRLILQRARALRYNQGQLSGREIAYNIALEAESIWSRAAIPCKRLDCIQIQVMKLMDTLNIYILMKHWSRLNPEKEPLKSFTASLDQLFDVANTDIKQRMSSSGNTCWREDYQFYIKTRKRCLRLDQ